VKITSEVIFVSFFVFVCLCVCVCNSMCACAKVAATEFLVLDGSREHYLYSAHQLMHVNVQ